MVALKVQIKLEVISHKAKLSELTHLHEKVEVNSQLDSSVSQKCRGGHEEKNDLLLKQ